MTGRGSIAGLFARVNRTMLAAGAMLVVAALLLVVLTVLAWLRVVEVRATSWRDSFVQRVAAVQADMARGIEPLGQVRHRLLVDAGGRVLQARPRWLTGADLGQSQLRGMVADLEPGGSVVGLVPDPVDNVRRVAVLVRRGDRIGIATLDPAVLLPATDAGAEVLVLDPGGVVVVSPGGDRLGERWRGGALQLRDGRLLIQARDPLPGTRGLDLVVRQDVTGGALLAAAVLVLLLALGLAALRRSGDLGRGLRQLGGEQQAVADILARYGGARPGDLEQATSELESTLTELRRVAPSYRETSSTLTALEQLSERWHQLVARATEATSAVAESELRLRGIFDAASTIGLVLLARGRDGRFAIEEFSRGAELIFGHRRDEVLGTDAAELLAPADRSRLLGWLEAGEAGEDVTLLRAGVQVPGHVDCHRHDGGVLLVFQDLSERRALEEQLQQSRKMDAVGQLAGGVAHDFNNLLAGISGYAELLQLGNHLGPEDRRNAERIVAITEQAARLTQQLLAFSRKAALVREAVDLREVVEDTAALLRRTIDRSIAIEVVDLSGDEDVEVTGDRSQIQNALINLGINARDAMPHGGRIEICLERRELVAPAGTATGRLIEPGEWVVLSVADTGEGIDPQILPHIFDPFFTTKEVGKGTGLGLAAVYGSVNEHRGLVDVVTESGTGSRFEIYLPPRGADTTTRRTEPRHAAQAGGGVVLVVDDEDDVRSVAVQLVEALGYRAREAEDGDQALELLAAADDVDLVLLDMVMPKRGGSEVLREIRRRWPRLPVVVVSGYSRDDRVDALLRLGARAFLQKPFRMGDLSEVMLQATGGVDAREG